MERLVRRRRVVCLPCRKVIGCRPDGMLVWISPCRYPLLEGLEGLHIACTWMALLCTFFPMHCEAFRSQRGGQLL